MARRFLVTGGAGYVGSHLVAALVERGDSVVVLDNLRTGHRAAVPPGAQLVVGDLADGSAGGYAAGRGPVGRGVPFRRAHPGGREHADAVPVSDRQRRQRHAADRGLRAARRAALRAVLDGGAVRHADAGADPGRRAASIRSRRMATASGSSSARCYWADRVHGLRFASLRYFNAAGADPAGAIGEDHRPESHLIPLVIDAALGRRPELDVYGNDYPTPDGTCLRDYVHVTDLADAHLLRAGPAGARQHHRQSRQRYRPFGAAGDRQRCSASSGRHVPYQHLPAPAGRSGRYWSPRRSARSASLAGGRASPTWMRSCAPRCCGARRTPTAMATDGRRSSRRPHPAFGRTAAVAGAVERISARLL